MKLRKAAPLLTMMTVAGVTLGLNAQVHGAPFATGSRPAYTAAAEQSAAIESVAVGPMVADLGSFIPAQPTISVNLRPGQRLSASSKLSLARKYSPSLLRATRRAGEVRLRKYFTGAALAKYSAQHARMMRGLETSEDPDFRPLASGVTEVVWNSRTVDEDTATLTGEVTAWSRMAERNPETGEWAVAEPHNRTSVHLTLVKQGDEWRVSDYAWEFPPGESP